MQLPVGKQSLELRYRSYPFLIGLVISFLTLLVTLVMIVRDPIAVRKVERAARGARKRINISRTAGL